MWRPACWLAALLLFAGGLTAQAPSAESLFVHGALREARSAFADQLARAPGDRDGARRLAVLDLWGNRLDEAAVRLSALIAADSADTSARAALEEVRYRQHQFGDAARLARGLGHTAQADQLASVADPYRVSLPAAGTRLPSVPRTLLPVFHVQVNGRDALMILDTGGGELILDPAFADSIGARRFGTDSGTYAGGKRAAFAYGTVDSVRLGEALIRGVPVHVQGTRAYASEVGAHVVEGIIGTILLAQFRATLDFADQALRLEPRGTPVRGGTPLPFWLLGDHLITTPAVAMGHLATLLIFDTGLALPEGAFVPGPTLLARSKVVLPGKTISGVGGGGAVQATPFTYPALTVGPFARTNLVAIAGVFPPSLEHQFGPELGGIVSHGFFTGHRVTIDFDMMRVVVDADR